MERIDFPDGEWIEVREAAEVPERLRRPYLALGVASSMVEGAERVDIVRQATTAAAVAIVAAWSYPTAVSAAAMDDLPSLRYDEIMSIIEPRTAKLAWSMVADAGTLADPKATGDGSSSSVPGSTIQMPPPTAAIPESPRNT